MQEISVAAPGGSAARNVWYAEGVSKQRPAPGAPESIPRPEEPARLLRWFWETVDKLRGDAERQRKEVEDSIDLGTRRTRHRFRL